jgi:hypothetical protein
LYELPVEVDKSEFNSLSQEGSVFLLAPFDKSDTPSDLPVNLSLDLRTLVEEELDDFCSLWLGEFVESFQEEFHQFLKILNVAKN